MPCNGDYHGPTVRMIELSKVCYLLDELDGKEVTDSVIFNGGYHPTVQRHYINDTERDNLYDKLCSKLMNFTEVYHKANHSLEMQIWWRDHQIADKAREAGERAEDRLAKDKDIALAKLTEYEKTILKIKE